METGSENSGVCVCARVCVCVRIGVKTGRKAPTIHVLSGLPPKKKQATLSDIFQQLSRASHGFQSGCRGVHNTL